MGSRARKTVAVMAPGGGEVTSQTSGHWDTAGIIQKADGTWFIAAWGNSHSSVYNRTHAKYNRDPSFKAMHVGDLTEVTAPLIREYFGTHQVTIESAYSPGAHEDLSENDLRTVLYAAGASLDHMRGSVLVAMDHPGKRGHAGVQLASGIAGVSYAGGKFSLERLPAGWYSTGIKGVPASRSFLRQLARSGYTAIAFRGGSRIADFQASELLKSMNARTAR